MTRTISPVKEARCCQSCGLPVGPGSFGTKRNQGDSREYCRVCFQNGAYTDQDMTLERMIEKSAHFLATEFHVSADKARSLAKRSIPKLKRWNRS